MSAVKYLADTSAAIRMFRDPLVRTRWQEQIVAGLVATCPAAELEFLYAARSKADRERMVELLAAVFTWTPMPERAFERAHEVQALLTNHGWHRSASVVDLLVAAAAETQRLTLLHYDHDFDQIVKVTGQPALWIAEPGSVD